MRSCRPGKRRTRRRLPGVMEMYLHAPCYIDGMIRPNLAASLLVFSALFCRPVHAQTSTATVLTVTVNGSSASQISAGSPITLTATVTSGGSPITQGQVNFCNAAVVHCTDVNVLGTAPLGPNGAATLVLRPGTGAYSYRAGFLGTPRTSTPYAASSSSSVGLTVSSSYPSASTITATGNPGNYTLVASVFGFNNAHSAAVPTGTVSFIDSTTGNSTLGTASLETAPTTFLTVLWAPLLLLPAAFSVRRKMPLGLLLVMTVALLTLPISGCSGNANSNGGTNSGSGSNSQTTLVTSSSTITLQVQ